MIQEKIYDIETDELIDFTLFSMIRLLSQGSGISTISYAFNSIFYDSLYVRGGEIYAPRRFQLYFLWFLLVYEVEVAVVKWKIFQLYFLWFSQDSW